MVPHKSQFIGSSPVVLQVTTLPQTPESAGEGMLFGQLILSSTVEIGATKCQILRLNCTKIDFGWGSAPDPAGWGGGLIAPPYPLAGFKRPYL